MPLKKKSAEDLLVPLASDQRRFSIAVCCPESDEEDDAAERSSELQSSGGAARGASGATRGLGVPLATVSRAASDRSAPSASSARAEAPLRVGDLLKVYCVLHCIFI